MVQLPVLLPRAWFVLSLLALSACGGDSKGEGDQGDDDDGGTAGSSTDAGRGGTTSSGAGGTSAGSTSAGTTSGGSTSAGTTNGGSTSGTAGSTTTAGTSATAGSSTGGSGQTGACSGTFGAPVHQFSGTIDAIPNSLSVTGDDLELFYVEQRSESVAIIVRKRASRSETFGAASELPAELYAWCPTPVSTPSVDVTEDGLRLYMTCIPDPDPNTGEGVPAGPIRLAERPDRDAPFVLLPDTLGATWNSISISPDELSLLSTDLSKPDAVPLTFLSQRSSTSVSFEAPVQVSSVPSRFRHPEFAFDSLHVFGADAVDDDESELVMLTRANSTTASFGGRTTEGLPQRPPAQDLVTVSDLTPTLSADCKSIHFLRLTYSDPNRYDFAVYSAQR